MAKSKLKMTKQRRVIVEELKKLKTHPTATLIYELVRKRLPRISLGTVYRNLDLLAEAGIIQKLETAGTQKRFDGTVETITMSDVSNAVRLMTFLSPYLGKSKVSWVVLAIIRSCRTAWNFRAYVPPAKLTAQDECTDQLRKVAVVDAVQLIPTGRGAVGGRCGELFPEKS